MSFSLEITDTASPALQRLGEGVRRPAIRRVMGRGIVRALREHFRSLDSTKANRMGGKRTHFWSQVRKSVHQPELIGGDGVKVAITHVGIAQRYFGGVIVPDRKKWLAVPARAEAHGRRPLSFHDLHFVLFRRDLAALVQNYQTQFSYGRRRKDGTRKLKTEDAGGGVFYWLVKRVVQRPDPTVLPPRERLIAAAVTAAEEYIEIRN
jgi:hypothetical protein